MGETFNVVVTAKLNGLTQAQLAAFITAALAAVPSNMLASADLNVVMEPAAPANSASLAS